MKRRLHLLFTGATDDGFLEGTLKSGGGKSGLFPTHCVQEVRLRHHNIQAPMIIARDARVPTRPDNRVLGRRESTKHFATAPRLKKSYPGITAEPRTVVLHKGRKGFGFILRGAKATSPLMDLTPSERCPALQYLDDVDPGGVADMAGLKKGDFLLEINNEDVSSASHEHVVDLIRKSGNLVSMTVVSLCPPSTPRVLPSSKSTILPGGNIEVPLSRQYATLPRKLTNTQPGNIGTLSRSTHAPLPPRRDPKTTLSVGRARAKSLVAGLEAAEKDETDDITKSSSAESIHQHTPSGTANSTPIQPRTASIRQRPTSSRITSAELEELFQRQKGDENTRQPSMMSTSNFQTGYNTLSHPSSPAKGRVYASVAEMKRSKSKNSKVRFTNPFSVGGELRRNFHSTPDLAQPVPGVTNGFPNNKGHRSQEDVNLVGTNRNILPPPTHPPPPPPPLVQVIKVDVSRGNQSEYENFNKDKNEEGIVSSFKPTASAKLYASPEDMKTVGYRSKSLPSHSTKSQVRKSHSMRTNSTFKPGATSTLPSRHNNNPYAQPIRASRSHSTAGTKERKKRMCNSKSASNVVILTQSGAPPPIPEPDYSCSDSEVESDEDHKDVNKLSSRLTAIQLQPVENSGNSNTSGSSSGSSSIPHSFSVEEIQKGRSLLKSSKSYPDDFLKKSKDTEVGALEDGDNSSSGVSSDQEVPPATSNELNDRLSHEQNSMTLPASKSQRTQISLSRHAVSLAQLPPPIEADSDEKEEFCLPPPPEFGENHGASDTPEAVLAPPPQFSDSRQVTRVRIVGAVPKGSAKMKQGRLHSQ